MFLPKQYPLAIKWIYDRDELEDTTEKIENRAWLRWFYDETEIGKYRPLPRASDFHKSRKRFRFCMGGNRSSKSHALAAETVYNAIGWHPVRGWLGKPTMGYYATTTWDKVGDTLWVKLKQLLTGEGIKYEIVWHNKQRDIPEKLLVQGFCGLSTIVLKAFEQGRESFQATDLDYAHFDEQFPQDIFIETFTRIGPDRRMDFAAAMTPIESQPWLEERLSSDNPSDAVFEFPLDDNRISRGGFIDDELIDATIENWPPEVRQTRRLGKWGSYLGSIFQSFSRQLHVVSEADERELFFKHGILPKDRELIGAIDWGGNNPFGFLWGIRIPWLDDDWYIFDEYYWEFKTKGPRLLKGHADEILGRTAKWGGAMDRIWADHDPTDAGEMYEHGVASNPANKAVTSSIEHLQTLFMPRAHLANQHWLLGRPRIHIAERCVNLIRQIPLYRWAEGTEKKDSREEPVKKDDHLIDALRYLTFSDKDFDGSIRTSPPPTAGRYRRTF